MSAKLTARDRMTRLLAVIPWVVEQDGALLDDIATRFDYPRDRLVADLTEVVLFVGVHPFTPDSLIEVDITDDRVQIRYADWFSQPLRLTPEEGARLLTAGRSVLSLDTDANDDGGDPERASPLLRALTKLGMALGESAERAVDVRLGDAPEATLDTLRQAVAAGTQVELDYYTYGRDELTTRVVDPARVFSDHGNWYLHGYCHRAADERVFRVDRVRDVRRLDTPVAHELEGGGGSFTPDGDDPRVQLHLPADAGWVVEQYPTEAVETRPDGSIDVVMAVTATPWLERLLLRLGPGARIVEATGTIPEDLVPQAAARVLARYRS
ncbi:MAG: WYL domain-containing protein [Acidimicrobiales bacterium]|nr:WYL domain-containing protein [Acidimicrobiales bacterium]